MNENENRQVLIIDDARNRALHLQERLQEIGVQLLSDKYKSNNTAEDPVTQNFHPFVCLDTVEHSEMATLEKVLVNHMEADNVILERARDPGKSRQTIMLRTYKEIYGSPLGEDPTHGGVIDELNRRNPALDTIALKMKAIRLLNREGVKKPTQEQIKQKMDALTSA